MLLQTSLILLKHLKISYVNYVKKQILLTKKNKKSLSYGRMEDMQKQDKNFSLVHRLNVKMLEYFFADIGYSLNYSAVLLN